MESSIFALKNRRSLRKLQKKGNRESITNLGGAEVVQDYFQFLIVKSCYFQQSLLDLDDLSYVFFNFPRPTSVKYSLFSISSILTSSTEVFYVRSMILLRLDPVTELTSFLAVTS